MSLYPINLVGPKASIGTQARTCKMRMRSAAQRPGKHALRKAVVVVSNLVTYSCLACVPGRTNPFATLPLSGLAGP